MFYSSKELFNTAYKPEIKSIIPILSYSEKQGSLSFTNVGYEVNDYVPLISVNDYAISRNKRCWKCYLPYGHTVVQMSSALCKT